MDGFGKLSSGARTDKPEKGQAVGAATDLNSKSIDLSRTAGLVPADQRALNIKEREVAENLQESFPDLPIDEIAGMVDAISTQNNFLGFGDLVSGFRSVENTDAPEENRRADCPGEDIKYMLQMLIT